MPDEIIIKIKRNRRRRQSVQPPLVSPSSGILRPNRFSDYEARRLQASGINFYDFGQFNNAGVWADSDLIYIPATPEAFLEISSGTISPSVKSAILAKFNAPLLVAPDQWKSRFRRLEYTEAVKYRFNTIFDGDDEPINQSNPEWKANGLKTRASENLEIENQSPFETSVYYDDRIFFEFATNGNRVKVTALPDYSAPSVDFELLNKSADIFLNPQLLALSGYHAETSSTATESAWVTSNTLFYTGYEQSESIPDPCAYAQQTQSRLYRAQVKTRNAYLETRTDWLNYFVENWQRALILNDALRLERDFPLATRPDAIAALKLHPNARRVKKTIISQGVSYQIRVHPDDQNNFDPSPHLCGVPPPPTNETTETSEVLSPSGFPITDSSLFNDEIFIEGMLLAVIKQGAAVFYVWRKPSGGGGET